MIITIVSFVVVLGILVVIHELGHYWAARRNGIVVEEFGVGYPPRLVKLFTYKGTDFTLNALPLGGFARMKGEDAGDMTPGSLNAASRGARAVTLAAGPAMNALLAIVLFAASFMAGFPAAVAFPQVTAVESNSLAAQIGIEANDILLAVGNEPVHVGIGSSFDYRVLPRAEERGGAASLTLSRAGQVMELPVPAGVTAAQLLDGLQSTPVLLTEISAVAAETPAEEAGLLAGDLVYAVNDSVVTLDNPLNLIISLHLGEEVTITVLREGRWLNIEVTPRADPPEGQGALGVQIGPMTRLATLPVLPALWQGVVNTWQYVVLVLQLPIMLIIGQMSAADAQLTGPVGIAQLVGGAVTATIDTGLWFPILRLSAVLSAALAVTNLLPLPALDGGRLLFVLVETLRGRRINPEREGLIHMVGFVLLLGVLVLVTVRDITTVQQAIDWRALLGQ
jgi:regulator of sigma E protease